MALKLRVRAGDSIAILDEEGREVGRINVGRVGRVTVDLYAHNLRARLERGADDQSQRREPES
jgi:hypothetical protein